jgi:hypothetical protein
MRLRWASKPKFDLSRPASGRLPAMKRHSPAPSFGHSNVTLTQEAAIQFESICCFISPLASTKRCYDSMHRNQLQDVDTPLHDGNQ